MTSNPTDDGPTGASALRTGEKARTELLDPPHAAELKLALPFGVPAFAAAMVSLAICYGSIVAGIMLGIHARQVLNPHLQAVLMWGFALLAVYALWQDRKRHRNSVPMMLGAVAVATLIGTLYLNYDVRIEALSYILLAIAALLNWIVFLGVLNRTVRTQAREIEALNQSLERRVETQTREIDRLGRLKQFLPPHIAEMVVSDGHDSLLNSHRRYIACLFCDLREFTALSEEIEPEEVIAILQSYHDQIGRLVMMHRGTIGFRAGDGLMVFFNDPVPCDEPVLDAVKLALDICAEFRTIREQWTRLGHPIGLGIGIASGYATMGPVGFEGRADYTAIGGAVNIASRLCDQAADGQILLNQRAYRDVEGKVKAEHVGASKLKGVRNPVETYAVLGLNEITHVPGRPG